jgi:hypothetical protein
VQQSSFRRRPAWVAVGTIPPSGELLVPYVLPQVASGATNVWLQAYAVHDETPRMGGFSVVTVLDSIY